MTVADGEQAAQPTAVTSEEEASAVEDPATISSHEPDPIDSATLEPVQDIDTAKPDHDTYPDHEPARKIDVTKPEEPAADLDTLLLD